MSQRKRCARGEFRWYEPRRGGRTATRCSRRRGRWESRPWFRRPRSRRSAATMHPGPSRSPPRCSRGEWHVVTSRRYPGAATIVPRGGSTHRTPPRILLEGPAPRTNGRTRVWPAGTRANTSPRLRTRRRAPHPRARERRRGTSDSVRSRRGLEPPSGEADRRARGFPVPSKRTSPRTTRPVLRRPRSGSSRSIARAEGPRDPIPRTTKEVASERGQGRD